MPNVGRHHRIDASGGDGRRRAGRTTISNNLANVGRLSRSFGYFADH